MLVSSNQPITRFRASRIPPAADARAPRCRNRRGFGSKNHPAKPKRWIFSVGPPNPTRPAPSARRRRRWTHQAIEASCPTPKRLQSCDKNYSLRFLLQHCKFSPKKFSIPTLDFRKALPRSCSHGTPLPCGQSAPQTNKSPWRGNLLDEEPSKSHVGHASRMPSKKPPAFGRKMFNHTARARSPRPNRPAAPAARRGHGRPARVWLWRRNLIDAKPQGPM